MQTSGPWGSISLHLLAEAIFVLLQQKRKKKIDRSPLKCIHNGKLKQIQACGESKSSKTTQVHFEPVSVLNIHTTIESKCVFWCRVNITISNENRTSLLLCVFLLLSSRNVCSESLRLTEHQILMFDTIIFTSTNLYV